MGKSVGFWLLQKQTAHHRRQRKADEHGNENGNGRSDTELKKHSTGHAGQERNGQENNHQRNGRCQNRKSDFASAFNRRLFGVHPQFFDATENILKNNDRVIDHHPDHQYQGQHRHVVQRKAECTHECKRCNDRCRYSDRCDQRGTP